MALESKPIKPDPILVVPENYRRKLVLPASISEGEDSLRALYRIDKRLVAEFNRECRLKLMGQPRDVYRRDYYDRRAAVNFLGNQKRHALGLDTYILDGYDPDAPNPEQAIRLDASDDTAFDRQIDSLDIFESRPKSIEIIDPLQDWSDGGIWTTLGYIHDHWVVTANSIRTISGVWTDDWRHFRTFETAGNFTHTMETIFSESAGSSALGGFFGFATDTNCPKMNVGTDNANIQWVGCNYPREYFITHWENGVSQSGQFVDTAALGVRFYDTYDRVGSTCVFYLYSDSDRLNEAYSCSNDDDGDTRDYLFGLHSCHHAATLTTQSVYNYDTGASAAADGRMLMGVGL